jgi:hypothetical protein
MGLSLRRNATVAVRISLTAALSAMPSNSARKRRQVGGNPGGPNRRKLLEVICSPKLLVVATALASLTTARGTFPVLLQGHPPSTLDRKYWCDGRSLDQV